MAPRIIDITMKNIVYCIKKVFKLEKCLLSKNLLKYSKLTKKIKTYDKNKSIGCTSNKPLKRPALNVDIKFKELTLPNRLNIK